MSEDLAALSDAELQARFARGGGAPAAKGVADMTNEELLAAHAAASSPAGDVAKSAGTGLIKGLAAIPGILPSIVDLPARGLEWAAKKVLPESIGNALAEARQIAETTGKRHTAADLVEGVKDVVPLHKPESRAGRITEAGFEFAPGALSGPGGIIPKIAKYAAIPGAGSELAGEAAQGTGYEPAARVAGALLGVGAGAGAGRLVGGAQNRLAAGGTARDIADVLNAPVTAGAVRRASGSAAEDAITPTGARDTGAQLGHDDTMVLDLGRQLRGRAEAIASQPGAGQNKVLNAVEGRTGQFGAGTADRVQQTLDQEMGQSHNVVELQDRVAKIVDAKAKPLYDQVMAAHPVLDVPIEITGRPAVASAMKDAVKLAENYGEKLSSTQPQTSLNAAGVPVTKSVTVPAKTSLEYWDYVKKSLDQRIKGYYSTGGASELSSAEKADLGGLQSARTALVEHLDQVTNGAYKQARQVAATKPQLKEALEFGQSAFSSKLLPEEFMSELSGMSIPQQAMVKAGFRRELDRLIESTRNEGATARRALDTNQVIQKTEALFGAPAAREIERRVAAETHFQNATQDIAQNSRTAVRQELRKDTATPSTGDVGSVTIPGLLAMAGRGGLNYMRGQGMSKTRDALGEILTAKGDTRDQVVDLLLNYNKRRAANSVMSGAPGRAAVADALIAGQH